jgi:hypothetical protein
MVTGGQVTPPHRDPVTAGLARAAGSNEDCSLAASDEPRSFVGPPEAGMC